MIEVTTPAQLTYDERGLIPCVVQQYDSGEVLMVAWMNEESVGLTLELWTDCDSDTLLVKVDSPGPACHTGARSCFFKRVEP